MGNEQCDLPVWYNGFGFMVFNATFNNISVISGIMGNCVHGVSFKHCKYNLHFDNLCWLVKEYDFTHILSEIHTLLMYIL